MRYRLVETIVPLAASAHQLVDYVHADGSDIGEAASDLVDWTYESVPGLIKAGRLPDDLASALRLLRDQALAAAHSAPHEECATRVLRPEWSTLRATRLYGLRHLIRRIAWCAQSSEDSTLPTSG